jgi:hypothetical protein
MNLGTAAHISPNGEIKYLLTPFNKNITACLTKTIKSLSDGDLNVEYQMK